MFPGPAESILAVREEKFLVGAVVERVIFCVDFSECRDVGRELRSFSMHVRQGAADGGGYGCGVTGRD